jgi:hypothetical protein
LVYRTVHLANADLEQCYATSDLLVCVFTEYANIHSGSYLIRGGAYRVSRQRTIVTTKGMQVEMNYWLYISVQ